ncbi:GNAT family N-acetyltransferase [Aquimarina brevivitae]|uniref:GNAT family acetyltransferase n=1 Tax=Aquimarina brevivitae TaxID=323412 RepID=A0A4Q7PIC8_9FLAO|nr:GNAT family N-acetyltransferase [Aquimarina brevivitae]RZS99987.1 GNAT family acetyltransferase [Aquimarina brevivitae]
MKCKITQAQDTDLPLMQRFFYETVTNFGSAVFTPAEIKMYSRLATNRLYWLDRFKHSHIYNAKLNGEVVGSVCMDSEGHLDFIFVHPRYQGQGIAKELYDTIEQVSIENELDVLTTEINSFTKSFFEKNGFVINKNAVKEVGGGEIIELTGVKHLKR